MRLAHDKQPPRGQITGSGVWQWSIDEFHVRDAWAPSVNIYRYDTRLEVCVDLAGVDRSNLHVEILENRLTIRGLRHTPEQAVDDQDAAEPMQIIVMEIDHGSFRREIDLPPNVDVDHVESRYTDGLLWIDLPIRD